MEVPIPVVHSPQSWLGPGFISPWSGQMWVIAVWAISGAGRLTQRLSSTAQASITLRHHRPLPSPRAHSCHNQWNGRSLKPPEPWLNLHLWNARVWAGIYSMWAVNYVLLIYSSQNDNCSPWHNSTMCDPLLQIGLIAFCKGERKKLTSKQKQNKDNKG